MLVTSRSFAEYRAMFDLRDEDLAGTVLDCCAGAASFVAELADRGGYGVAVDPAYGMPRSELVADVSLSLGGASQMVSEHEDQFVWDWYGSRERREEFRTAASRRFLSDYTSNPSVYVAGGLPDLPFDDRSFDLVLCSHLLFTWSNQFDGDWHLAALRELVRICRREVRVFPLVIQGTGDPVPFLAEVRASLARDGVSTELRQVPYEFQRDANTMLVVRRTDLVAVLRRWEESGAIWRVLRRSDVGCTVALYRCDDGEEMERYTTTDSDVLAYVGERSTNADDE